MTLFAGALAANIPGGQGVAGTAEELGDSLTLAGVGINYSTVVANTPIAASELVTEVNENIANIETMGNSLTPEFVSLGGNAGTAWGTTKTTFIHRSHRRVHRRRRYCKWVDPAASTASSALTSAGNTLAGLFSSTGSTAQNVTDTVTGNNSVIASGSAPTITGAASFGTNGSSTD